MNVTPFALAILVLASCQATQGPLPSGQLSMNVSKVYLPGHCSSTYTFQAASGTPPITYSIASGPGTVNATTGAFIENGVGTTVIQAKDAKGLTGTAVAETYWSLTNNQIKTAAQDSLGNTYLGGTFVRACPILAPNAVFVTATGTPDYTTTVGTGFDGTVYTSVRLSDGSLIVGGTFTHYNGTATPHIAKFTAAGVLDTSFTSGGGPSGPVRALVVDSTDHIFATGSFASYNSAAGTAKIVKLTSTGAVDSSFVSHATTGTYLALALDNTSSIYVAGNINFYNGSAVNKVLKLSATTGALDTTFATGVGSGPDQGPNALVADSTGGLYVGGNIGSFNGTSVNHVVKLNTTTGARDGSFTSALASGTYVVYALALDSTGLYVGGSIVNGLAKLTFTGAFDSTFNTGTGITGVTNYTAVDTLTLDGNGNLYVGGSFTTYQGIATGGAMKVDTTTASYNASFSTGLGVVGSGAIPGTVYSIVLPNSTATDILLLGSFSGYQGYTANHIAEFDSSWNLVSSFLAGSGFDPGVITSTVNSLAIDSSNNVFAGGVFAQYRGVTVDGLTKINGASGGLLGAFGSAVQSPSEVDTLTLDGAGYLYIAGPFTAYNGTATSAMTRVSAATGLLDTTYNTNLGAGASFSGNVPKVLVADSSFNIYAGGTGFTFGPLEKIASTGAPVATFNSGGSWFTAGDTVNAINFDASGNLFVGGSFSTFRGVTVNNLVQMTTAGVIDAAFTPGVGFDNAVAALTPYMSGSIFSVGGFTTYKAVSAPGIIKLNSTTAAQDAAFQTNAAFSLQGTSTLTNITPSHSTKLLVITSGGPATYTSNSTTSYFQNAIVIDAATGNVSQ